MITDRFIPEQTEEQNLQDLTNTIKIQEVAILLIKDQTADLMNLQVQEEALLPELPPHGVLLLAEAPEQQEVPAEAVDLLVEEEEEFKSL